MYGLCIMAGDGPVSGDTVAEEQTFEVLLREFRRVGVDPDTFSAMLAVRPEDAMRALRVLPDGAGPSAFLTQLRTNGAPHGAEDRDHRHDKTA
jgi:hypothetical protein